jgi:hypothetical protein
MWCALEGFGGATLGGHPLELSSSVNSLLLVRITIPSCRRLTAMGVVIRTTPSKAVSPRFENARASIFTGLASKRPLRRHCCGQRRYAPHCIQCCSAIFCVLRDLVNSIEHQLPIMTAWSQAQICAAAQLAHLAAITNRSAASPFLENMLNIIAPLHDHHIWITSGVNMPKVFTSSPRDSWPAKDAVADRLVAGCCMPG